MTDEEKERVFQMLLSEIRADHTTNGLSIEFEAKPIWEPYVEALLATSTPDRGRTADCYHLGAETGVKHADVITARLVQDERG
jgi:hypothetical protein